LQWSQARLAAFAMLARGVSTRCVAVVCQEHTILNAYQLCPDIVFAATPPYDGTLCRYYRIPGDLCYKLPNNLTLEDGAMVRIRFRSRLLTHFTLYAPQMEPLSVGIHSVANLGALRANESIAIFGAGPVGLLCMAVAKALGARRIIAVDIVPSRLDFAKQYAATDTYLPPKPQEGESKIQYSTRNAKTMMEQLGIEERGQNSIDLVIDASGAEVSIQTGLIVVRHGGRYVQVSVNASRSRAVPLIYSSP
jgi:D-xylulose reductase